MVCGAAVNYKWKQKGLSSAFLPERDPDSLARAEHARTTGGRTHAHTHMLSTKHSVSHALDY